jgi:putative transposase
MPRSARSAPGGLVYHVLNRANGRAAIFEKPRDYWAFERAIARTMEYVAMRVLAYCLMPTHWHFVLWSYEDGDLAAFMHRLSTTHVRRWHLHRHSVGTGHVYQGTFKSFPVQTDEHLITVCRYVERNPVRAGLVERAQDWRWSSLSAHLWSGATDIQVADWPFPRPIDWMTMVNTPLTDAELEACRLSATRGRPFGESSWQVRVAQQLGLEFTLHPRGRPSRKS